MPACKTSGNENTTSPNIEQIFAGGQCGGQDSRPGLMVLSSGRDLDKLLARDKQLQHEWQRAGININFVTERIVFISMGLKRTGGYGLELMDREFQLQNDRVSIHVRWYEPPAGSILTQALTSPCLFVTLPRGGYRRIRVVDAAGKVRLEAAL